MKGYGGSSPTQHFDVPAGSRVYVQTEGADGQVFFGFLIPIGPNKIPTWMYEQFRENNSQAHVYVSLPHESPEGDELQCHFIANLKPSNYKYNFSQSRCYIRYHNTVLTTILAPNDWRLVAPGISAIFVRLPDNNHITLGGVLHSWDDEDGILPEWVC